MNQNLKLPSLFGVAGREMNVYFDNLIVDDADKFGVTAITGNNSGAQLSECYRRTPTTNVYTWFRLSFFDKRSGEQIGNTVGDVAVFTAAANSRSGETPKLLLIGDSLTADGTYPNELAALAAADVFKPVLVGTQGTAPGLNEGRPGWTIKDYYQPDAAHQPSNPFVAGLGGTFDFARYQTVTGLTFGAGDCVVFALGTNDFSTQASDADIYAVAKERIPMLAAMVASVRAVNPAIRVAVCVPPPPAKTEDAFQATPGLSRWRCKRNMVLAAQYMLNQFLTVPPQPFYCLPVHAALDTYNNMPFASPAPVNSRSTVLVSRQNIPVHMAPSGYKQAFADVIWAWLKN